MSRRTNFITDIIDADLKAGRHTQIVTRFPPEPNGYLHIGHAKSICLNYGLARDYQGTFHLRFDDTNPVTEDTEYVDSIKEDVAWLGGVWNDNLFYASDYFEKMYGFAVELIEKGLAYVDDQTLEEIRERRGTVTEVGVNSPWRERSVEENLALFAQMRAGAFPDGAKILRAKIDMSSPNMLMRDPILYRIKHATHHRTGDAWCIYPMYDFAHCLEDALEHITHSICTLEFENNRELYDWVIANVSVPSKPRQIEFARLNLEYTLMSKRKLMKLVNEGHVDGWDDPRLPTVAGLRRRGVTPEAIRAFADMIGVARVNSLVDIAKFDFCVRDDLNTRGARIMAVLNPLKVTITTLPQGHVEWIDASLWPHDVPREGTRALPLTREIFIERDDFAVEPPKGWKRLCPGDEVRLRHAYVVRCDEVIRDEAGEVVELRCSHDPQTASTDPADGRKIRGVIHWVSAELGVRREVRVYDRLFTVPAPEADPERPFTDFLNPASLTVMEAVIEPAFADAEPGSHFQFERIGYFFVDPKISSPGAPVFNRVVGLRDSWAKAVAPAPSVEDTRARKPKEAPAARAASEPRVSERERQREANPAFAERFARLVGAGVAQDDADILSTDDALSALVDDAVAAGAGVDLAARWAVQDVARLRRERGESADALTGASLASLLQLVADGRLTVTAGREVLQVLLEAGGDAAAIMQARGLEKVSDAGALAAHVEAVISQFPNELARYREGKTNLLGFFVGKVMQASGGSADAAQVRTLLLARLDG